LWEARKAEEKRIFIYKGEKMKKLLFGMVLLALVIAVPTPTMAMGRVDVGVSIPLPPPIGFAGPPEMVVIPETYIYVAPDVDVDVFFYGGWWWRPWEGRWYRSQNYNSGWGYYEGTPSFYGSVHSGWRNDYRQRRWGGHQWNYQRIPHQQVQRNWQGWERDRHWEKQNTWGVRDLRKPQTRTQQPSRTIQQRQSEKRSQDYQDRQQREYRDREKMDQERRDKMDEEQQDRWDEERRDRWNDERRDNR
jgi:hypothetical protein